MEAKERKNQARAIPLISSALAPTVEDASASQARCTCYGRDTETRETHVSEKHNEVHNCCHGDSTVALGIIATQEYK